jgi:hypothetical protein
MMGSLCFIKSLNRNPSGQVQVQGFILKKTRSGVSIKYPVFLPSEYDGLGGAFL